MDKTEKIKLSSYYFGFEPTGVYEIDKILDEVCAAGKAHHCTDGWNEDGWDGKTYIERIQEVARLAIRQWVEKEEER